MSVLNDSLVSDIYVGDDGKLHKVQGGADSVLPFSSGDLQMGYFTYNGTCPSTGSSTLPSLKSSKLIILSVACVQYKNSATTAKSYKATATLNGNSVTATSYRYGTGSTYPQGTTIFEFEDVTEDDVIAVSQLCWGSCEIYYFYV